MTSLAHRQIRYASASELQVVDVWERPEAERVAARASNRYWFIFIHGGAWRDPRCLTDTAVPAIDRLMAPPGAESGGTAPPLLDRSRIAGFASVGYRLSPHPAFPQDPATTPPAQLRSARHPDHLLDVRAALAALARDGAAAAPPSAAASAAATTAAAAPAARPGSPADYLAHDRYVVYGHSCGAFLAFQLWMSGEGDDDDDDDSGPRLALPCVVGLEGIYDLRGLVERGGSPEHGGGPGTAFAAALQALAEGAFGRDRAAWDAASPARYDWAAAAAAPQPPRLAVLAYSPEDELVDSGEVDAMEAALARGAQASGTEAGDSSSGSYRLVAMRDLRGRHDQVHSDGREVARVLTETVRQLDLLSEQPSAR